MKKFSLELTSREVLLVTSAISSVLKEQVFYSDSQIESMRDLLSKLSCAYEVAHE